VGTLSQRSGQMNVPTDTPTILVVFGATGDLMERKIAPALYRLRETGQLPERFRCVLP
jgi:glucose-6-phosphate 1-dehydrogenase